jgi:sarcosine oxidase
MVLIGPPEPKEGEQALVYASYYDAARIQRIIGKDPVWTELNAQSASSYSALESETGIRFHLPKGCLYVCPHGDDDYLKGAEARKGDGHPFLRLSGKAEIEAAVAGYSFPEGSVGLLEKAPAGMIKPRLLVQAQQKRFLMKGGQHIQQAVISRQQRADGHLLTLQHGSTVLAEKVLVAAGSFTNFNRLLPRPVEMSIKGELVLLAEVSDQDAAQLSHLPALLYECYFDHIDGIYLTPPLRYPGGKWYLKMGANVPEDVYFTTLAEVQDWFTKEPDVALLPRFIDALEALLPHVAFASFEMRHCIIHRKPSLHPVLGTGGAENLYYVAGCNGYSAMCSDALGKLAAQLLKTETLPDWAQSLREDLAE